MGSCDFLRSDRIGLRTHLGPDIYDLARREKVKHGEHVGQGGMSKQGSVLAVRADSIEVSEMTDSGVQVI